MEKKIAVLLLVIFIGGLLFPVLALAGEYKYDNKTVHYEGLVPCGKSESSLAEVKDEEGNVIKEKEDLEISYPCEFCHLFVMLDGIIDFVTQKILPAIVILMMVIAGIMFFFAGGNPSLLLQAKKLITSVVIGVVIIFSAYLIIGTVLTVAGVQEWTTLDQWLSPQGVFIVDCPIGEDGDGVVSDVVSDDDDEEWDDEPESKCEDCGGTWWDFELCDKEECLLLGNCKFTGYIGWGDDWGYCKPADSEPEEEGEGEWISENTDTSADNIKVLDLSCSDGTKLEGEGICEALGQTDIKEDEPYGDNGWYCKFKGRGGGSARGKLSIYCVPEVIANLSYTPIRTGDESVATEVNSVPSSQTVTGDDVYSITAEGEVNFPVSITLGYTDEEIAGLDENTLTIYRYDETLSRWVGLPSTVDTMNNTVTALTDHLSIFTIMGRKATVTDCECSSGDCCDGCHFHNSDEVCDYDEDEEKGCPEGTGCGSAVGTRRRFKYQHCSGNSSKCTGAWENWGNWGEWSKTNCSSEQICINGTCKYSADCGCECTSGRCCSDGCHYDPDDSICDLGDFGGCENCGYSSDCANEGIGVMVKDLLRCHDGLCSLTDFELKSCTCKRNTDGKICGEAKICEGGICVGIVFLIPPAPWDIEDISTWPTPESEEDASGQECIPDTSCCTSDGYYKFEGTRCYTDSSWSSCSNCKYGHSCDNNGDGYKKKNHKNCDGSGSCTIPDTEEKDCTCTRDTDGDECKPASPNDCYCSAGSCHCYGPEE